MYGLLLESISDYIKTIYGVDKWDEVREQAQVGPKCFSTHEIYSEDLIPNIAKAAAEVLGESLENTMDNFGVAFVSFVGQYGYDRILKVLGRNMRDFLNGLDNLHEYLRFSYPHLKPPSFFVENESKSGLTLHYRSRRRGYLHYVKGQIRRVGELFYNTKITIYVVDQTENIENDTIHVKFRLLFDNIAFRDNVRKTEDSIVENIPLRSEMLFELFPFHLVFSRKMVISSVGAALAAVMPDILGKQMNEVFTLARPLTKLCWEEVLGHTNSVFELVSVQLLGNEVRSDDAVSGSSCRSRPTSEFDESSNHLSVKGQMMFVSEWESIIFLGTPIMKNLGDMFNSGLYINDLSMHDSSRDLVLAGTQQSAELRLALDQEQEKSRLLEESMEKLDEEMKRTDALLYQMIPKPVADRLRRGEPSVATCQAFDGVTILFSDVVGFTTICSRITPMEVVSLLNAMYTEFDQLSEKHDVYKVETIGDAYMAVAGAPTMSRFHGLSMCNMALDMVTAITHLKDPSNQEGVKIRTGVHSGATVAGVVGIKMPRYCLFGDTVNTASRMETNGEAMKIHISETTRQELLDYPYKVQERGEIEVKGKGMMKTYWLLGHEENPSKKPKCPFAELMEQERLQNAQDHTATNDSSVHRHVYSPVSFDDLHTNPKPSADSPAHPSPIHQAHGHARRASRAANHRADSRASTPHSPSAQTPPSQPPLGTGRFSAHPPPPGVTTKPTQAVPPTRSGSCSPSIADGCPPIDAVTSDESIPPQQHLQGNGLQHQHRPPLVHSINHVVTGKMKVDRANAVGRIVTHQPVDGGRRSFSGSSSNQKSSKKTDGTKFVPNDRDLLISESRLKDAGTEKPKSKTCAVL